MPKSKKLKIEIGDDEPKMRAAVPKEGNSKRFICRKVRTVGSPTKPPMRNPQNRKVRVRVVTHDRSKGAYRGTIRASLNYVTKEGDIYDRDGRVVDKELVAERWERDRVIHHVMPSPEDGDSMTREQALEVNKGMMDRLERQTGPLEYVVSAECKDGRWHTHTLVRGVQDGHDIYLHSNASNHWLRHHAEEAATDVLGWRGARSIEEDRNERTHTRERDIVDERNERERDQSEDRKRRTLTLDEIE